MFFSHQLPELVHWPQCIWICVCITRFNMQRVPFTSKPGFCISTCYIFVYFTHTYLHLIPANLIVTISDVAPSTSNHPAQDSTAFTKCYQHSGDPPENARLKEGQCQRKRLRQSRFILMWCGLNSNGFTILNGYIVLYKLRFVQNTAAETGVPRTWPEAIRLGDKPA